MNPLLAWREITPQNYWLPLLQFFPSRCNIPQVFNSWPPPSWYPPPHYMVVILSVWSLNSQYLISRTIYCNILLHWQSRFVNLVHECFGGRIGTFKNIFDTTFVFSELSHIRLRFRKLSNYFIILWYQRLHKLLHCLLPKIKPIWYPVCWKPPVCLSGWGVYFIW